MFYGKVVDFFHFNIPDFSLFGKTFYSWPIFNVADISVTIGFLMILLGYSKIFNKKSADVNISTPSNIEIPSFESEAVSDIVTDNSENLVNEPEKTQN